MGISKRARIKRHLRSVEGNFSRGTENGPLGLCGAAHGMNQGKLRTNQPQLTPAQDYERKREVSVPRFVSDYQAVLLADFWSPGKLECPL